MGVARESDCSGRPLPAWEGCRVISDGEVFLMSRAKQASLDGPLFRTVGSCELLWTFSEN